MSDNPLSQMKKKRSELEKEQQKLIQELKTKYPKVYHWFIERKIDLTNLKKYSANISAALAILASSSQPISPTINPPSSTVQVKTIEVSELKGLSEDEKGRLVWERYGTLIHKTARKYDLDPNLIFATIMIESGGNTYAIRHEPRLNDASYGLGQMLYSTAKGIGFEGQPSDLFDPAVNIDLIGKYHRRNLDKYETLTPQQLTTAYNTGSPYKTPLPGHLDKFNKWYNRVSNLDIDLT